jgi:hypothetical protein
MEAVKQVLHNNRFFDIANNSNNNFVFNVDSLYCKSSIYLTIIPMVCFGILQCFSEQSRGQWDIF